MKAKPSESRGWGWLAKQCGVSYQSILNWRRLPGAPTTPDKEAWAAFVEDNDLGISGNNVSKGREELLKEKVTEEVALLRLRRAREEGASVPRAEVNELLLHVSTMLKLQLYQALEREFPPKCVGRTAAEISLIGRETADRLLDILTDKSESWLRQA